MNEKKSFSYLITGIVVTLFFALAIGFRIVFPYESVFVGDWIKFTGTDAWYHMRIIDNLAFNFPHLNSVDPYLLYPNPMSIGTYPFYDYFAAAIIQIVTLGNPTQQGIDMVGVYLPAFIGGLVVIPVFFIGRVLFNRWAGIVAAGLIAFSPGELLGRSIIGQMDHHVFEVVCSTTAILFFILALKNAKQKSISYANILGGVWSVLSKPLIFTFIAALFLAIYLNSWLGALLFVFILFIYMLVQFITNQIKSKDSDYLCIVVSVMFFVTFIFTVILGGTKIQIIALIVSLLATIILGALSFFMLKKGIKAIYFPLSIIFLGVIAVLLIFFIRNDLFLAVISQFKIVLPTGARLTIEEAQSILFPAGEFSLEVVWLNFTTGSLFCLIALGILIHQAIKKSEPDIITVIVWSIIILVLTLIMRRFAYYFAVNVALLTSYVAWLMLRFFGFREANISQSEIPAPISKKVKHRRLNRDSRVRTSPVMLGIGAGIIFVIVLFPSIIYARNSAKYPPYTPSNAWCESMEWLKKNTPEPYNDPGFYYSKYDTSFKPSSDSYGIAAQWDFGYWIAKFAHRPPIINPGVLAKRPSVANYFLSQDEESAISNKNARDSKYIMMDYDTAMPLEKYYSWLEYAGISQHAYYDVYIRRNGNQLNAILLYHPEYYRSLAARLYNFDCKEITPRESIVISYADKKDREGTLYKEITSWQTFTEYDTAKKYVDSQQSGNFRIVGSDPFRSPVPIDALKHYKLVYSSTDTILAGNAGSVPIVKIFEYNPATTISTYR